MLTVNGVLLCPSAPPEIANGVVFGVVSENRQERMQYLDTAVVG